MSEIELVSGTRVKIRRYVDTPGWSQKLNALSREMFAPMIGKSGRLLDVDNDPHHPNIVRVDGRSVWRFSPQEIEVIKKEEDKHDGGLTKKSPAY